MASSFTPYSFFECVYGEGQLQILCHLTVINTDYFGSVCNVQYWIWIFIWKKEESASSLLLFFFLFYLRKRKKTSGDLRWFAYWGWSSCWCSSLSSTGTLHCCVGGHCVSTLQCHTINATRETKTLLPLPSAVISPPFILPPLVSFPAIYNYDARGEEELSLQIGDTVHILEKYEGEIGLRRHGWTSVTLAHLLHHVCVQSHISCSHLGKERLTVSPLLFYIFCLLEEFVANRFFFSIRLVQRV